MSDDVRESNRLSEERFAQLDRTLRGQALETQTTLRALAEGQRLLSADVRALAESQRLVVEGQRLLVDGRGNGGQAP